MNVSDSKQPLEPGQVEQALARLLTKFQLLEDPDARLLLRALAGTLIRVLDASEQPVEMSGIAEPIDNHPISIVPEVISSDLSRAIVPPVATTSDTPVAPSPSTAEPSARQSRGFVPLRIGEQSIQIPVAGTSAEIASARLTAQPQPPRTIEPPPAPSETFARIMERCAIKVEACELALHRLNTTGPRSEIDSIIARAKSLPSCFLWMFMPGNAPADRVTLELARDCYACVRDCARLLSSPHLRGAARVRAVALAAEAQSALRAILRRTWMERDDHDQYELFRAVRAMTEEEQVYVERYLRLDDPASPSRAPELLAEVAEALRSLDASKTHAKEVRKAMNKVRYHAQRITEDRERAEVSDWKGMLAGVTQSLGLDKSCSDDLRALVEPAIAWRPEGSQLGEQLQQLLSTQGDDSSPQQPERTSDEVASVRAKYAGKRLVIFGGTAIEHQRDRIRETFQIGELDWIHLREHASSHPLRAAIDRPETALVVGLIRLAGHQHIDDARRMARDAGKPFVCVPAGFSPAQLASCIVEQAL